MGDKRVERRWPQRDKYDLYDDERRPSRYDRVERVVIETKYVFRVHGRPKPPANIHARGVRFGEIFSTSDGPYKVVEIWWSGNDQRGWKADVLLRPVGSAPTKQPARDGKQGTKNAKFKNAKFKNAKFKDAKFKDAKFKDAKFKDAKFKDAKAK